MASRKQFALLFIGGCVFLSSIIGFVFTVQHQGHCEFESVRDDAEGATVQYYSELSPAEQETFLDMTQNREEQFERDCAGGVIRYEQQYYVINTWNTIIWFNPPTIATTMGLLTGTGLIYLSLPSNLRFLTRVNPF